jgi:hypothetical protein
MTEAEREMLYAVAKGMEMMLACGRVMDRQAVVESLLRATVLYELERSIADNAAGKVEK